MKNLCILCYLCIALSLSAFAQETEKNVLQCGTPPPTPEEVEKLPYFNNGQYLIDEAIKRGLRVEKDYLQKLNESNAGQSYADYKKGLPAPLSEANSSSSTHYYIPVKAYIWTNSSGTLPFTGPQVEAEIDQVNQYYDDNDVPITLYLQCGILVGANNSYYNITSESDFDDMLDFPGPGNTLRIHFVNSIIIGGTEIGGKARFPNQSNPYRCALSASGSESTLAHEIGHNLGLHHTHNPGRSLFANNNKDCSKCYQESVSRSKRQGIGCLLTGFNDRKCEVNGDFLCDTPADPNLFYDEVIYVDNSCNYDGRLGNDKWGAAWQPDEENIMSYSFGNNYTCRSTLTPQQTFVMLINLPSFATTSPGYFISGPSKLCPNQSATYSVSAISGVSDYQWEIPSGWTISGQGNRSVTITASSNSNGTIRVTPNCGRPPVSKSISNQLSSVTVNGPYTMCEGQYAYYSTSASGNSYTWTIYGDLQIVSGQGTSNIQVYAPYGSGGGYVSVSVNFGSCSGSNGIGVSVSSGYGCQYAKAATDSTITKASVQEKKPGSTTKALRSGSLEKAFDVTVYPNPSAERMTLSFDQEGAYAIELVSEQGRVLQRKETADCEEQINVNSLRPGLYYLRISSGSSVIMRKVFVE